MHVHTQKFKPAELCIFMKSCFWCVKDIHILYLCAHIFILELVTACTNDMHTDSKDLHLQFTVKQ